MITGQVSMLRCPVNNQLKVATFMFRCPEEHGYDSLQEEEL